MDQEIRGPEVNVLLMCGRAGTAASAFGYGGWPSLGLGTVATLVGIVKAQWRRDDDPSELVVLDPFKHSAFVICRSCRTSLTSRTGARGYGSA
jgi:hypothetical protein